MQAQAPETTHHCPRCELTGKSLRLATREKICLHERLDPQLFAELFWDEV